VKNVELKARAVDWEGARRVAASIATQRVGTQHQIDTYFHCRKGRLKLRQINGLSAQLIAYARPDEEGPKTSDYRLVPVANPESLKAALTAALGVRIIVDKRREIYLVDNVRIHLDDVCGLGQFLEFEAVLGPGIDETTGRKQLARLADQFSIRPEDRLAGSYADLLETSGTPRTFPML
jgi:adenylate cyclase class 2